MRQLGQYGLNCCLCDEMGLGKTIQSLTVIINEAKLQPKGRRPVSLVVCPNTLTFQWHKEISKFFGDRVQSCVHGLSSSCIAKASRTAIPGRS